MERKLKDDHIARKLQAFLSDEDWDKITQEDRNSYLALSEAAARAFQELLEDLGGRIMMPGMIPKPTSDAQAHLFIKASQEFLAQPEHARLRRQSLVSSPKLILPYNPTRQ